MYKSAIRPVLLRIDPERSHQFASSLMKKVQQSSFLRAQLRKKYLFEEKRLQTTVCGLHFPNPIGLGAGFDKYAELIPFLSCLGFGHIEVGTITAKKQDGNPKPRLFRLPLDKALINRMGFNNNGADETFESLEIVRKEIATWNKGIGRIPLGVNIGKSKITPLENAVEDYAYSFQKLYPLANYFTINVSSPNTPGLRMLQDKPQLKKILSAVQSKNQQQKPIFVKIAPDLSWKQVDDVLSVIKTTKLSGIIVTNTTLSREGLKEMIRQEGGLSGRPVKDVSTAFVRYAYQKTQGKLPIIGVGGVFTAQDAYEKIKAGASLVQVYTGFVYEGPSIVKKLNRGLLKLMEKEGFSSIRDVVGSEHR